MAKKKSKAGAKKTGETAADEGKAKLNRKDFERELYKLHVELCHLQEWVKLKGLKVVAVFEGRDTAGKGSVIKRITERVSPRVFRVVALPTPTERERTQFYFQRYIAHLPAAGEVVLFDRSWYNRAGVERVMGFCTDKEYEDFLRVCPGFERELIESGIILIKYFLVIDQAEQERRFSARMTDPRKHWKLSPMDLQSWRKWWDYTGAFDRMMRETDTENAPWHIVRADDKRRARLNCIAHLLDQIPYEPVPFKAPKLPKPPAKPDGAPQTPMFRRFIPERY